MVVKWLMMHVLLMLNDDLPGIIDEDTVLLLTFHQNRTACITFGESGLVLSYMWYTEWPDPSHH
jgi:hypothetical protein